MRIDARYDAGITRLRALLDHPMESGLRTDRRGGVITANFIRSIEILHDDEVLLEGDWGGGVSRNPYLAVEFDSLAVGDKLTLKWTDNDGQERAYSVTVKSQS